MILIKLIIKNLYNRYRFFANQFQLSFLRFLGSKIHSSVTAYGKFSWIGYPKNLILGENVTINEGVHFNLFGEIEIKDNVRISTYVQFHTSKLNRHFNNMEHIVDSILIGRNSWIASGVVLSPGVEVSENCTILANSVVTKSLKESATYAGIPAKLIK